MSVAVGVRTQRQMNDLRQSQLSRVLYWRFFLNLGLMLCDAVMFILAGVAVLNMRGEMGHLQAARLDFQLDGIINDMLYMVGAALVWIISLHYAGVYHRHVMGDGYQLNLLLFKGMVLSWIALCAVNFVIGLNLTLGGLTLTVFVGWLFTMMERVVSRVWITQGRRKGAYSYGTVLVGSPEGIGRTLRFLRKRQQLNYYPVAVCPIRTGQDGRIVADSDADAIRRQIEDNWRENIPVVQYNDRHLAENMVDMGAQTVMISDVLHRSSDNFNTFSVRMESLSLEIALITSAADTAGHETTVRSIQGNTVITMRLPQYTPAVRIAKRAFDLVVSCVAILLSLFITVPVAIAIKLTDGGPIFYTQTRIGLRGVPFKMIKFCSMVTNADELKAELAEQTGQEDRFIFKMKDDPRITKVGHFIRRFSIDELPQFLNVFVGDMSVVGPRPPLPEEYERYNQLYATRMLVKPGITGPWQVSGRSDLSAEESEALDVSYVQNWSVLGDVVLLFRTVGAVLSHKGAY